MTHEIIENLSEQQSITILNWVNKKLNVDSKTDLIIETAEAPHYTKLLLHLIIETDVNDTLELEKQLIKNKDYFEFERANEQKKKSELIDILSLIVAVFSWLNIKPLAIDNEIIETDLRIKVSKKAYKTLKKNGLIRDSYIIIEDRQGKKKKIGIEKK